MDVYSKPGTKVIFDAPENGYEFDQRTAKKYLKVGAVYTVAKTEVHSSSTDVYLVGFPGCFNSVFFGSLEFDSIDSLLFNNEK